ncbi:MAG: MFS transporter, partial [Paracoccaceae bacterium]
MVSFTPPLPLRIATLVSALAENMAGCASYGQEAALNLPDPPSRVIAQTEASDVSRPTIPDKSQPAPQRPAGAMAPFRHRDFRILWSATLVSNFGGLVQAVGAAWLMTQLTDSATLIALVQASNTLPVMLLAIASGALADTIGRKTLLMAALVFMAVVSVALAAVAWAGLLSPWSLLAFTFLLGAGQAVYNPPWQASMGDLVPREDLPAAVSLNSV